VTGSLQFKARDQVFRLIPVAELFESGQGALAWSLYVLAWAIAGQRIFINGREYDCGDIHGTV